MEQARQSHPLSLPSPAPSPGHSAKGAFSPHASSTHPRRMDKRVPPQSTVALQHIVSIFNQRGQAACFELTAFLLLINISCCFHFCTSTHHLQFILPPIHFHCPMCVLPQVGFLLRLTPCDQRSDVLQDLLFGCQT